jgi:phenylacetic acid degradation operon negative regulatory protein
MQPRSMLYTVYGVFIRHFSHEIALSAVVDLLTEFGFNPPAVRAAMSRLAAQGWLDLRKDGRNTFISLTERSLERVDEAATRIYRLRPQKWNGQWLLLTYTIPEEQREMRDALRADLDWWGFGTLGTSTRLSPHELSPALAARLNSPELAPYLDIFSARYTGSDRELVSKGFDVGQVNERYRAFLARFKPFYTAAQATTIPDEQVAFVQRCTLVHEYRKFLFVDPGLPEELLGEDWLGSEAFALFHAYDQLLAAPAGRYFYRIYAAAPGPPLPPEKVAAGLQAQLNPFAELRG